MIVLLFFFASFLWRECVNLASLIEPFVGWSLVGFQSFISSIRYFFSLNYPFFCNLRCVANHLNTEDKTLSHRGLLQVARDYISNLHASTTLMMIALSLHLTPVRLLLTGFILKHTRTTNNVHIETD